MAAGRLLWEQSVRLWTASDRCPRAAHGHPPACAVELWHLLWWEPEPGHCCVRLCLQVSLAAPALVCRRAVSHSHRLKCLMNPRHRDCTPTCRFAGGWFEIVLNFPKDYPFKRFRIAFTTKIYHPSIDQATGEVLPVEKKCRRPEPAASPPLGDNVREGQPFEIVVKTKRETITLKVTSSDSIECVKAKIQDIEGA
jgi:hypothetical protein